MQILKETFEWNNGFLRQQSWSDVEVYKKGNSYLMVATEREDNGGFSITNGAELIWKQLCDSLKIDPENCIFVEHYPYTDGETWDRVYVKDGKASWESLGSGKFQQLLDEYKNAKDI